MVLYGILLFRKGGPGGSADRFARPALLLALGIHTALIYAETVAFGHCLVYSPFELMTMIAFTLSLTYLIVELVTGEKGTGVFFIGLALIFQILSGMFEPEPGFAAGTSLLQDVVGLHISAALVGYTAFTMSAVWGLLYLMQHHEIRANRFGPLYNRLPSLGLLERMSATAAIVGLIFLSIAILIALFWMPDTVEGFSYGDPKVVATIVIWFIYAVALAMKYVVRVDQRRFVLLSLIGFGAILLSMTIVNFLLSRFHDFR